MLTTLLLLSASMLLCAQPAAPTAQGERDALALAVQSQRVLNEYVVGAMEPEAMKYAQRLKLTQAALDTQYKQWPMVTSGPDPWDRFRPCKNALEKASYVAALSGMKAVSKLDDKVFSVEKNKLQQFRAECDAVIKREKPGSAGR
ncbi:hypothetical protein [Polaromonas sp.]|uniref:hypothetical protein n=1 Tax=Polaromonas sp. TaxID=1869339 RepID=UPI003267E30C